MKTITLDKAAALLLAHDRIKILTHTYPDGDCLGSGYALAFMLRKLGKKANVAVDGNLPSKFGYLIENYEEQDFIPEYIVSVDVAAPSLLGESVMQGVGKIDLCIDHHGTNSIEADYMYVDSGAAAAAEIIWQLLIPLGVEIDSDIATGIYTGISTDTGCFVYTNTTPRTHHIAASVMPFCDWNRINYINFVLKTRAKMKLEREILDTIEYYSDGKIAIIYTTLKMCEKLGTGDDEMEGLASIPREIEGVKMGITMREKEGGVFKISVRTNDGIDAAAFCKRFDGGGHPAAAGCSIEGDLKTVKAKLVAAAEETLG